jgi:prepilin-type N-terminal cleavage/methylation domain-containing protein
MKNQKGFTLVELMVVMAIIAILSTAGISQYGKFIKNSRDSARMDDISALNTVISTSLKEQWIVPDDAGRLFEQSKLVAGKYIMDPMNGKQSCVNSGGDLVACGFEYAVCDGGTWYMLMATFESIANIKKYREDEVSSSQADAILDDNKYEIGNCETIQHWPEIISGEVKW